MANTRKIKTAKRPARETKMKHLQAEDKATVAATGDWRSRLRALIDKQRLSMRQVSIAAGLHPTTVSVLLGSDRIPSVVNLMEVCKVLRCGIGFVMGEDLSVYSSSEGRTSGEEVQMIPVVEWEDITQFLNQEGDVRALRKEAAAVMEPASRRFRLDWEGSAMSPVIESGSVLDCSAAIDPEPDDYVIVYLKKTKRCILRQLSPSEYNAAGYVARATLKAANKAWPPIMFSAEAGDQIVAVVISFTRQLRRVRTPTKRRK